MACTIAAFLALALGACASTRAEPSPEAQANAGFARIQVHEAEMAAADRRRADGAAPCAEQCATARDGCAASDDLCAIATQLADPDALTRCERARDHCAAQRAHASSCDCPANAN